MILFQRVERKEQCDVQHLSMAIQGSSRLCRPEAEEDESDAEVDQTRLRMYERSKLRYFFAIVECDVVSTASNLYAQCDGLEFELTANK